MSYALRHLATYLESSAERHAARPAVVDPAGRAITYEALNAVADRIASFLIARGISPGQRVGIFMPKSIETVAAMFGILKAGAAYVPVDPTGPLERARTIFTDCAIGALFVHETLAPILNDWPESHPLSTVVIHGRSDVASVPAFGGRGVKWDDALAHVGSGGVTARETDGLAYILYTSGSTGIPKGVQINHSTASSFIEWGAETFSPTSEDRFSSHAPFHFDLSIFDIYVAMRQGASVHLIAEEQIGNPRQLAQFIAERDITVWYSTPSALTLLGQHGRLARLGYKGPRIALFAGEVFPVKHLRQLTELWPASDWYNLYGPTETNVCTFARIPLPVPQDRTEPYPIGVPCFHCEALVLQEDGTPASDQEGVLFIAGDAVFQGYWNRPVENGRAFRTIGGQRYYDTGDVVRRLPGGELAFIGRRDRMVKRHGYRIELGEIEKTLYRHPSLTEVGVVSLADDAGVRIVACYTSEEPAPSIVDLKQFSSRGLPTYMIPDDFKRFERLPSTSTGKMDYQRLKTWLTSREAVS